MPSPDPAAAPPANLLAGEDSPYLLQHANNPVAWQPWGEAAFARARREDKPVFLSIGYSTCHWCHVMEHESFENPEIAAFLNQHFVSIKVDREERPDVDLTYMAYVQAATGHGGWPMTVFLTPEARPFFGGTYFPPEDRHGCAGFLHLIGRIADLWGTRRADLEAQAEKSILQLQQAAAPGSGGGAGIPDAGRLANLGVEMLAKQFDRDYGGFGGAPKFPRPAAPFFLLECARRFPGTAPADQALAMAVATLDAMAAGGIHDHLGGGFHRYAVDRIWHIPHYEKMLYDQAQLAPLFVEAARLSGRDEFRDVAAGVLGYVARDLSHPDGGFFSAEDADSLPSADSPAKREGAFYVFTETEIRRVLAPAAAEVFCAAYGIRPGGNADPASDPHGELAGTNTLFRALGAAALARACGRAEPEIAAMLDDARAALLDYRDRRPRPHRDEKIVAGWNGLMMGAFATTGRALGRTDWIGRAVAAADFLRRHLWDEAGQCLYRSFRKKAPVVKAFATDYAQVIGGLLDVYAATGDTAWLDWALALQAAQDRDHLDAADGTYFSARADGGLSVLSLKDDHDGAEPSANSQSALNLVRMGQLLGHPGFLEKARHLLAAHAAMLENAPHVAPMMAAAALRLQADPGHAVIAPSDHPAAAVLAAALARHAPPDLHAIALPSGGPGRDWWTARHPWLADLPAAGAAPALFLCRDHACGLPAKDPDEVAERFGAG